VSEYIAFDSHKHYTLAAHEDKQTGFIRRQRVNHAPGAIRGHLSGCESGTAVAVEATGNWYWIFEEIEAAGLRGVLVHPRKAKLMMGMVNKTDKLDADGLNRLQRNGTLPTVWVPPEGLRDLRELTRGRLVLTRERTRLKNRIQATLARYGLTITDASDVFAPSVRPTMVERIAQLPVETRYMTELLLGRLDELASQVAAVEKRLKALLKETPEIRRLVTLPGIGDILSVTILLEVGEAGRFPSHEHLASYAGTTPRVKASGDKVRYGKLRQDVNQYLKWAYLEAANSVALNHTRLPGRFVSRLYRRLSIRRGPSKAKGAVARHLAEATWHVLTRREPYRERGAEAAGPAPVSRRKRRPK
jgi:transposase